VSIREISIIGLGVIGGSLGLALRRSERCECEVVGFARSADTRAEALRLGAVDRVCESLVDSVSSADMVVLATPVRTMEEIFRQISDRLKPGAIVTDVGSTKADVARWARRYLRDKNLFVGGHPMAGSAATGISGARADLFEATVFCVVRDEETPVEASQALEQLVGWIGATPLVMTAAQHDQYVAGVSHLPVIVASALVTAAATHDEWDRMSQLAAQGFREMTRMAAGSSEVRHSLCSTNQKAITEWIERFIAVLKDYREHILRDDEALLDLFRDARQARRNWIQNRYKRN
jgi:prephenate dehydrogenase